MSENNLKGVAPAFPVPYQKQDNGMTLRQYAAIKLKVPNSGTDWLVEMILESLRNDLAAKAMQGYLAAGIGQAIDNPDHVAQWAYENADATLEARQKPRVEGV